MEDKSTRIIAPIREGLFFGDLSRLADLRLLGSRCSICDETSLGHRDRCASCGSDAVSDLPLSNSGSLWTYTVVRHQPPGNYRGPDPFVPFGVGLVELPEGLRVMTPIDGEIDNLRIGMPMNFVPRVRSDEDRDVVAFNFVAAREDAPNV